MDFYLQTEGREERLMHSIKVDDEIYAHLKSKGGKDESFNDVLHRELGVK